MRIITTWMTFEASQVEIKQRYRRFRRSAEEFEPGIGIAWCAGDTTTMMPISNLKAFSQLQDERELNEEVLRTYIDALLSDEEEFEIIRPVGRVLNPSVVDFLLDEPFVVERSPPIHLSLKGVLTQTNMPVWIGTYIGWDVAPDHSVLLFITIPGGIIIVSSAVGLAGALASGLSTSVKRLFKRA